MEVIPMQIISLKLNALANGGQFSISYDITIP